MSKSSDYHFIKQVCFRIETEIEDKQDELCEAVKQLISPGDSVNIKRGSGVWRDVTVIAIHDGKSAGYFVGQTSTGNYHTFYYKNIIL